MGKKKVYDHPTADLIGKVLAESIAAASKSPGEVAEAVAESMRGLFIGRRDPDGYKYELIGHEINSDGTIILHVSKSIEYIQFSGRIDTSLLDTFKNPELGIPFEQKKL
jgi:hypothetical protein